MSYDDAKEAILNSSESSSVYIGADSIRFKKRNGDWYAKYSTVIILHVDSKHGAKIFHKSVEMRDYGNLRQRLITEAGFAIEAASEIVDVIGNRHMEIHLDINPNPKHKSNIAVKEALGYVKGTTGLDAVIKPHSFAATHAADHVVRH
ncbi:MAG: hypothetical protein EBU66_07435 [Bacteroidetes bacterium]|nr:hypothetical protein [Bacteroidota bacterium]